MLPLHKRQQGILILTPKTHYEKEKEKEKRRSSRNHKPLEKLKTPNSKGVYNLESKRVYNFCPCERNEGDGTRGNGKIMAPQFTLTDKPAAFLYLF